MIQINFIRQGFNKNKMTKINFIKPDFNNKTNKQIKKLKINYTWLNQMDFNNKEINLKLSIKQIKYSIKNKSLQKFI